MGLLSSFLLYLGKINLIINSYGVGLIGKAAKKNGGSFS